MRIIVEVACSVLRRLGELRDSGGEFTSLNRMISLPQETWQMEYQVVIGHDRSAKVWFVRTTNIPGLALEDPSLDNLLDKLPEAVSWLLQDSLPVQPSREVPFEVLLVQHERARLTS